VLGWPPRTMHGGTTMRPITAAAIMVIGLIAAACGDSSSSEPTGASPTEALPAASLATAVGSVAPGTSQAPEPTAAAFGRSAVQSSSDDPEQTHALMSGRYRFAWDTPSDAPCERVEIAVTQVDGDFSYVKGSTAARFNATVNDVPQGHFKLEQLDPGCQTWDLRIDWMTN